MEREMYFRYLKTRSSDSKSVKYERLPSEDSGAKKTTTSSIEPTITKFEVINEKDDDEFEDEYEKSEPIERNDNDDEKFNEANEPKSSSNTFWTNFGNGQFQFNIVLLIVLAVFVYPIILVVQSHQNAGYLIPNNCRDPKDFFAITDVNDNQFYSTTIDQKQISAVSFPSASLYTNTPNTRLSIFIRDQFELWFVDYANSIINIYTSLGLIHSETISLSDLGCQNPNWISYSPTGRIESGLVGISCYGSGNWILIDPLDRSLVTLISMPANFSLVYNRTVGPISVGTGFTMLSINAYSNPFGDYVNDYAGNISSQASGWLGIVDNNSPIYAFTYPFQLQSVNEFIRGIWQFNSYWYLSSSGCFMKRYLLGSTLQLIDFVAYQRSVVDVEFTYNGNILYVLEYPNYVHAYQNKLLTEITGSPSILYDQFSPPQIKPTQIALDDTSMTLGVSGGSSSFFSYYYSIDPKTRLVIGGAYVPFFTSNSSYSIVNYRMKCPCHYCS